MKTLLIASLVCLCLPAFGQSIVIECDTANPGEQHVIDRVYTGNRPDFTVNFYENKTALASMSNTWYMTFFYCYSAEQTNGLTRISGTWTSTNQVVFTNSTAFSSPREWYFSIYGTNTTGQIRTFARGKMIEEYDPATALLIP